MDEKQSDGAPGAAGKQTREERLAAKLRENLRRRKAQARAIEADGEADRNAGENAALPKDAPKS